MWSLLRRPQPSASLDHSQPASDETFAQLFAALLDEVKDTAAQSALSRQFEAAQTAGSAEKTVKLAATFEAIIKYLSEHQPPATKTILTQEEIQALIAKYLDPSQLEPALMAVLGTGMLQLAGVLGIGIERLTQVYYANLTQVAAREDLDALIGHLPYQVPPNLYSDLTASEVPSLRPLLKPLSDLGRADLIANLRFMYQHYIEALVKNNQQPQAATAMREVYAFISQTYPQELTLTFLDLVPAGWLEQERGNLLGREELLKVLDQLEAEKAKVEAVNVRDEALLASIGDGVVAVNPQGKVIFINDSAIQLLGMQNIDINNINWFETVVLVDKNDQLISPEARPMIQAMKTSQRRVSNDISFVRSDKTRLAAAITATPYIEKGQVSGAILVFKDMTREREIDRQKTEFISVASHQLRTPLGSMKLNLELLAKNYQGALPQEAADMVKETLDINERTVKLVNTLLDISRIETGRVQDNPVETKMSDVVDATLKELEPMIQEKKIQLQVDQAPDLPTMTIDATRLREIMENILSNAIKYSHEGGPITIKISLVETNVLIEVADQGIGIPDKEQFKVFSRFFRAENALNQEPNGSGFGLFVVKSYIEGWGGKIWFKSPTVEGNGGTTFYLQIPLKVETKADGLYLDNRSTAPPAPAAPQEATI